MVLAPVRGETAVLHDLLAHVALVEVADLLLERRDDASLAAVLLLLGGALAVARLVRACHWSSIDFLSLFGVKGTRIQVTVPSQ